MTGFGIVFAVSTPATNVPACTVLLVKVLWRKSAPAQAGK
jgi:hypothetical protein